jgi:hypothetical protein
MLGARDSTTLGDVHPVSIGVHAEGASGGVELPFAADCCPCVEKLRTVLPLTVGIRDGAVQLVSIQPADGGCMCSTAMEKLRIVIQRLGTSRQKMVLE